MKKDNLIALGLGLLAAGGIIVNIWTRNKAAYEKGRLDQLTKDLSELEKLNKELETH